MTSVPRVLVVEDDGIISAHFAATLEKLGYEVVAQVDSGEEALAVSAAQDVDVILMDVELAGRLDGIATATEILARRGPPVVFLTAHADAQTVARAKSAQPVGYLAKPFQDATLATTIEIGLEQWTLRRRLEASEVAARTAEARANAMAEHYGTLLRMATDGIHVLDIGGKAVEVSDAFCRMLGYSREELQRMNVADWDVALSAQELEERLQQLFASSALSFETRHRRKDGRIIDVAISGCGVTIGVRRLIYASARDVTDQKRTVRELEAASVTDPLTGLHNRRGFTLLAEQQLKVAQRRGAPLVLFFVDINGMKSINDSLGHHMGDRALVETAAILHRVFRESDVVARLGGDEFVALATDDLATTKAILERRIFEELAGRATSDAPFELSLSVGAANFNPATPVTLDTLLADADSRMYQEKHRSGRPPRRESIADGIQRATGAHTLWMAHVRDAIDSGVSDPRLEEVATDASCEFGQWIHELSSRERGAAASRCVAIQQLHAELHAVAAVVLRLALEHRKDEALRYFEHDGDLTRIATALAHEMTAWFDEEVNVSCPPLKIGNRSPSESLAIRSRACLRAGEFRPG